MSGACKRLFSTRLVSALRVAVTQSMGDNDVCFVAATRTPIGCFQVKPTVGRPLRRNAVQGVLSSLSATQLGALAIEGALKQSGVAPDRIGEALLGNVLSANLGQAPAKQACLKAGVPDHVPCTAINKVCASGMKSVMLGAQSIQTGMQDVVLVGGMESMSNVPHYLPALRPGHKMGDVQCHDGMIKDGLWDPYGDQHMGSFAEKCAEQYQISREAQDDYAIQSFERGLASVKQSASEITPVSIRDRKGTEMKVDSDEGLMRFDREKLRRLRPVFKEGGTVTAGNASQISDGAAALILAKRSVAVTAGWPILASLIHMTDAAQHPSWFTTTPALAIESLLKKSEIDKDEIELFEINEAFSVVALVNQQLLQLNPNRVNTRGGAVAIGHPLGCSGARILVTLIHGLKQRGGKYGIAAICNGGGGASAVLIRNEPSADKL